MATVNAARAMELLKDIAVIQEEISNRQLALKAKTDALRDEAGIVLADDAATPSAPATKRIRLSDEDKKKVEGVILLACKATTDKGAASGVIKKALADEGWKAGENLPTAWMAIVKALVDAKKLKVKGTLKDTTYIYVK